MSLDLLLMVLVIFKMSAFMLTTATKKAVLKRVIMILHVVVAVAEQYLAVIISKEGPELQVGTVIVGEVMNLTVVMVLVLCIQFPNTTPLHHAASQNHTNCGVLLVEAGADKSASDRLRLNPLEMSSKTFVHDAQKAYSFTTRRVIAVIGNSGHGKSTLVTALEHTSSNPWKKTVYRFKKVHDISQRTTGIEAVQVSNQKFGEALFYDFAGQSQYHGPHQSFLEAMLNKPEVSVTLLLLVKATDEEDIIAQQLYRWLHSLASTSNLSTPKVVVVGSFLDQVKSKKKTFEKLLQCTKSVKTELALDIQGPCLLDCRQPQSMGIDQICTFLQEACLVNTRAPTYNLHWVWVQMQKTFSIPALPFHEFQAWLQDNAVNLSRYLPSPEKACQDLSEAGHIFFLNERDASNSWLILKLQAILHDVYGTLFSGSFVNKFGLLHCSELDELFPKLNPGLIQKILISLELCIQIDPVQLKEEISKLTMDIRGEEWLYFPALMSAQPPEVFPEDPHPATFHWMCWQLRTTDHKRHFISAHLLQTIILRLAANHVFIQEPSPGVNQHHCNVWVNGISWSSIKGVDIAVQISDSSVVQVVGRSKVGQSSQRLQQYTSDVIQDVTKIIAQLSPNLEATPYIVHPYTPTLWKDPKAPPPNSLYHVSTIIVCIRCGGDHTPSLDENTCNISIDQLFGGELPLQSTVKGLSYPNAAQSGK